VKNPSSKKEIILLINGQIKGGKNNMKMTKSGRHYPSPEYEAWRDDVLWQLKPQLKPFKEFLPITTPVSIIVNYFAENKHRRDAPAIIDSLWHVLEKSGIVKDDCLLGGEGQGVTFNFLGIDKYRPRAEIVFLV
jgi:Holliday junction resolvase RusA-like endonuclease